MALISEYLAADLTADASADALGRINIGHWYLKTNGGQRDKQDKDLIPAINPGRHNPLPSNIAVPICFCIGIREFFCQSLAPSCSSSSPRGEGGYRICSPHESQGMEGQWAMGLVD